MQTNQVIVIRLLFLSIIGLLSSGFFGCAGDNPVSENNPGGGDTIVDTTGFANAPPIPKPRVPNDDPGSTSSIMTTITSVPMPNFAPYISRALVNWQIAAQQGIPDPYSSDTLWCDSTAFESGEFWSDYQPFTFGAYRHSLPGCEIPVLTGGTWTIDADDGFNMSLANFNPFPGQHLLLQNGAAVPGTPWIFSHSYSRGFCSNSLGTDCYNKNYLSRGYREIQTKPYIRRDRFWKRKSLEGSGASWLLLRGPVGGDIQTSYTHGVSVTETQSFARSLSITVGAEFGPFSSEVQVALEQSFETSVEITKESSISFTKSVSGETGKTIQFMVWELVDIYSITDSLGNPLTDPNYEYILPTLNINGIAIALDATVWNQ